MSKRPIKCPVASGRDKRKNFSLSIKMELLKKLEKGASMKQLSAESKVSTSTIYGSQ
jgi:hypothetical protein